MTSNQKIDFNYEYAIREKYTGMYVNFQCDCLQTNGFFESKDYKKLLIGAKDRIHSSNPNTEFEFIKRTIQRIEFDEVVEEGNWQ